jgi:pyruvate-formate lyase-activating enzyme
MELRMVFCDDAGRIFDHPALVPAGMDGPGFVPLEPERLVPLPRGSDLMMLPGRTPVGIDPETGEAVAFEHFEGRPVYAVAAFMAPGHTQTHRPAYVRREGAPVLPLFAYTALAFANGRFYAAGFRVDEDPRQDPWRFDPEAIQRGIEETLEELAGNRLVEQLVRCALDYGCRAAQNFFLGRHEAPLPVSTGCNAHCVGCISMQPDGSFKASHDRLEEPPSAEEVAEVALRHIERVDRAVVSFGQGCEGEPLTQARLVEEAIRRIRERTDRGTINLNSNASMPEAVGRLAEAGLDSLRVSLNSFREELYRAYYRPKGYDFSDVLESMERAAARGVFVSVNLLVFPGVTDTERELEAAVKVWERVGYRMVQMRNLNIDPEVYIDCLPEGVVEPGFGTDAFVEELGKTCSGVRFGYFNPPKETFLETGSGGGKNA